MTVQDGEPPREYVPVGQGLDVVLVVAQYSPAGHFVQFTLPGRLYQPTEHASIVPVTLGQYLPAGHNTHGNAGDSTTCPGAQVEQVTEPATDTEPLGQD